MNVADKVILITGASSGIGAALARNLAPKGAKLVLAARRRERLDTLAGEIAHRGGTAITVKTDVCSVEQVRNAVKTAVERFGRLDILVNNAGFAYFCPVEQLDLAVVEKMVNTNVYGPIRMIQAALPHLTASKGMVVNISSSMSKRALPMLSSYAGTKSMLDALSEGLRLEIQNAGVRVLSIGPGETESEFHQSGVTVDGTPRGSGRKLASADAVAQRIIRAIEREEREVTMSRLLKVMNFFAPKLLDKIFHKMMVEKMQ